MKERPILFSTEMIRAIMDGRKTQTRRVVKPQPTEMDGALQTQGAVLLAAIFGRKLSSEDIKSMKPVCPYGVPGDRLWARETWQHGPEDCVYYLADNDPNENGWRPSIHMPRWASRITLEVTDVRVQRLCEISDADGIAEGYQSASDFLNGDWARSVGMDCWVWAITFKVVK